MLERIARFVTDSLADRPTEPFEALALEVFRWQRARDPVLASLVEREPTTWAEIPAVPVGLFKDLPVGTVGDEPCVVFRTSGTTGSGRGEHRMRSTRLYDLGAVGWAAKCVPLAPRDVVALLDDPARTPDSSLSHMVSLFGRCTWHVRDGVLDRDGLDARARGGAIYVAATAFALAEWLEGDVPRLPAGSVVMVTGGFKGRVVRLDDAELYALARERLRPDRLVTEYGMTELSSQLWGEPGRPYRAPPWLRAVAVDPGGRPTADAGQLRFYDLCNLDGTLGIETLDGGIVRGQEIELHGRLPGAPARGCSLTVEEAWLKTR